MTLEEYLEKHAELRKAMKESGLQIVTAMVREFLARPEVLAIQWRQYTPSFNDGDPCLFSVNDPEVLFTWAEDIDGVDPDKYPEQEFEWVSRYANPHQDDAKYAFRLFSAKFMSVPDILEMVFGDGATITAWLLNDGSVKFHEEEYYDY